MSAPEGVDPAEALDLALERIAEIGHAPGCSGGFPPFRCKCRLAEDLAVIRAARYRAVPRPDRLSADDWRDLRIAVAVAFDEGDERRGRLQRTIDRLAPVPEKE